MSWIFDSMTRVWQFQPLGNLFTATNVIFRDIVQSRVPTVSLINLISANSSSERHILSSLDTLSSCSPKRSHGTLQHWFFWQLSSILVAHEHERSLTPLGSNLSLDTLSIGKDRQVNIKEGNRCMIVRWWAWAFPPGISSRLISKSHYDL